MEEDVGTTNSQTRGNTRGTTCRERRKAKGTPGGARGEVGSADGEEGASRGEIGSTNGDDDSDE